MHRKIELIADFYGVFLILPRNVQPAVRDFALPALRFVVLRYFSSNPADTADAANAADLQQPLLSFQYYLLFVKKALC